MTFTIALVYVYVMDKADCVLANCAFILLWFMGRVVTWKESQTCTLSASD